MNEENRVELFEFYDQLLAVQCKNIKELYKNLFSKTDPKTLSEFYMTYYAKVHMHPAFVYFIYNKYTKLIKIGKSNNPFHRMNTLNSIFKCNFGKENALSMIRIVFIPYGDGFNAEKLYHKKYDNYRTYGEWFSIDKNTLTNDFPEFLSYDTDGLLPNEGFPSNVIFEEPDDLNYMIFALDTLDDYTLKICSNDIQIATYLKEMIYNKLRSDFQKDELSFSSVFENCFGNNGFSIQTQNLTWEMFKWLYKNDDTYAISSIPHFDENNYLKRSIIGKNRDVKILSYFELVENMANEICFN